MPGPNHATRDNHNEITIETLKTPPLQIEPAPIRKRVAASLIDSLIVTFAWLLLLLWTHEGFADRLAVGAEFLAIMFLYYLLQESAFASTIGKRLLGVRVVGYDGDPMSMRQALIRNSVRLVDWLPLVYLLGGLSIAVSRKRQRLGDILAGTVVTLVAKRDISPPPAPFLFH